MISQILCRKCGEKWQIHPQDVREGWVSRRVWLIVKKPINHEFLIKTGDSIEEIMGNTANAKSVPLESIFCDLCGNPIADGETAIAVTMYREGSSIGNWEHQYGAVIPEIQVKVTDVLVKEDK